jgi:nucleoid DNA-binding protein
MVRINAKNRGKTTMNKAELIDSICKDAKLSKKDAANALEATMKNIAKAAKKEPVQLVGFGTFKTVKRKARKGINPLTKAPIKIPARKAFVFKASKNSKY